MKLNRPPQARDLRPCLWLLILCLLPRVYTQGTSYVIYGRVARPDDSPAARAIVKISGQVGLAREVYTDDVGRYEIRDLPGGRYRLTAVNPAAPDQFAESVDVDLNRACELNAGHGPALRGLGLCKFQLGDYAGAIQDVESAATRARPSGGRVINPFPGEFLPDIPPLQGRLPGRVNL